jgi:anti-sigma-K factor RskA
MNEMDPTERAQFEEDMRSDPNILIEVECFKRTLFKIQEGKSETEVPPELTQVIQAKARQNARKEKVFRLFKQAPVRYSAAAALLITAFLFGISFNSSNNSTPTNTDQLIQTATTASQTNYQQPSSTRQGKSSTVATWQDRQDVITIQNVNSGQVSGLDYDSMALKNAKKLRLINKPVIDQPMSDEIMLTRMPRNR